jgi:AGZA family xanthine/uracil permease-like MFS transporter
MLDNIGDMILMASLLVAVFGFPARFVMTRMIPGTAVGVLVGDLIFTVMAMNLARRTGRRNVTAMPLGLDTPSTFGAVFLILGPSFVAATNRGLSPDDAAAHSWFIGITMIFASAVFKFACAPLSGWLRRSLPRAGLLGSLVSIALVIISFMPLLDVASQPVAGFAALAVILATLTGRWNLPGGIPGALGAVMVGCVVYYGMHLAGLGPGLGERPATTIQVGLPLPLAEWSAWFGGAWREAAGYLPVALPLALATVVGGIDCTESAAAAGDEYPTGRVILADGIATLAGGIFGGVIQSTPYIGHPAYKAMGARTAYTLATAVFVGLAGILGYFGWIFYVLPKPVVFPILIFVGLEITAQSFRATPRKHYPALALACVPALAYLAAIQVNQVVNDPGPPSRDFDSYSPAVQHTIQTITILSGGFIVTSLLWATGLAKIIDGRMKTAAAVFLLAGIFALFGIIHSPLPSSPIVSPVEAMARLKSLGRFDAAASQTPYHWAGAYAFMAVLVLLIGAAGSQSAPESAEDEGHRIETPGVPI